MMKLSRITLILTISTIFAQCLSLKAQDKYYFIDGYHGGVYGHFPEQYTGFLVDQLNIHRDWNINLEIEPSTWDVVSVYEPVAYMKFREFANDTTDACRIEYVNPSFAQSYLYTCYGESAIRQFYYGIRKLRQHFPNMSYLTYSSEEPCFTSSLPTILSSFGFKYASTKNPNTCWGGYFAAYGKDLINWVGPDGESRILTSPRYSSEDLDSASTWRTTASDMSPEYVSSAIASGVKVPVGMCIQDAGWKGGPWLLNQENSTKPDSSISTGVKNILWREYFSKYAKGINAEEHTFSQEDIKPGLVWGAQILQRIAQNVRNAENKILQSEKLSSMSSILTDAQYPEFEYDEAWQNLLLAQHHDCWIVPYNTNRYKKTWAEQVKEWTSISNHYSNKATDTAITNICQSGKNIIVFNTTGKSRKGIATIAVPEQMKEFSICTLSGETIPYQFINEGKEICFIADVPAYGYATYKVLKRSMPKFKGAMAYSRGKHEVILANDILKIIFSKSTGGAIKSIKTADGTEYVKNGEDCHFNALRGFFPEEGIFHDSSEEEAQISIVENGPVRATICISGKINGQQYEQTVTVTNGSSIIDCSLKIDWKSSPLIGKYDQQDFHLEDKEKAFYNDFYKLHLTFPNVADGGVLYKDAPFDICKTEDENTYFDRWDEIKNNVMLSWLDLENQNGKSLALFCDHTDSYLNGGGHPLGLNVQFIGKALWGRNYTVDGPTEMRYALVPHMGKLDESGISSEAEAWNEHLIASYGNNSDNVSLIDLKGTGYQLVTTYINKNDMFIRLFNSEGNDEEKEIILNIPHSSASLVELDGRLRQQLPDGNKVKIKMPRFGIRTLKLENIR
jgi:alpha-mannosidase